MRDALTGSWRNKKQHPGEEVAPAQRPLSDILGQQHQMSWLQWTPVYTRDLPRNTGTRKDTLQTYIALLFPFLNKLMIFFLFIQFHVLKPDARPTPGVRKYIFFFIFYFL